MTPAQHQRIKDLFDEAFELPLATQARWLAQACPDDEAVHAEVEKLLHSQATHPAFLEAQSAAELLGIQAAIIPQFAAGRQLGPFQMVRELGQGGGGTVYLAERADGTYTQQVAIKLVWPGFGSEALLRFRQEREILARLNHPHIARLLDGGATAEGWHYLVMEYVEGQPLTTYCQAQQLSLRLDFTIKLWNPATGQLVRTLKGHANSVYALAFSPDGKRLASGSDDKTVRLWDLQTGTELTALRGHTGEVWRVFFTSDGKTLISSGEDGTRIWRTATEAEVQAHH